MATEAEGPKNFTNNLQTYKTVVMNKLNNDGSLKYYNEFYSNYKLVEETIMMLLDFLKEKQKTARESIDSSFKELAQQIKICSTNTIDSIREFSNLFKKFYGTVFLEYENIKETLKKQTQENEKKIKSIDKQIAKETNASAIQSLRNEKTTLENKNSKINSDLNVLSTKMDDFKNNGLAYFFMPYTTSTIEYPADEQKYRKEVISALKLLTFTTVRNETDYDPVKNAYNNLRLNKPSFEMFANVVNNYVLYFYKYYNANVVLDENISKYFNSSDLDVEFFLDKEESKWYDYDKSFSLNDDYEGRVTNLSVNDGVMVAFPFDSIDTEPEFLSANASSEDIVDGLNNGAKSKIIFDNENNIKGIYLKQNKSNGLPVNGNRYRGKIDFSILKERVKSFNNLKYGNDSNKLNYGLFELLEVALILYINSFKQANITNKNIELINNIFYNKENYNSIAYILQQIQEVYKTEIANKKEKGKNDVEFIEENWNAIYEKTEILQYWNKNITEDNRELFKAYLKEAVIDIYNVGPGLLGEMESTKKTVDLSNLFIKANGEYILKFDYFEEFRDYISELGNGKYGLLTKDKILLTLLNKLNILKFSEYKTLFNLNTFGAATRNGSKISINFKFLFEEPLSRLKVDAKDKKTIGTQQYKYLKNNINGYDKSIETLIDNFKTIDFNIGE